jgi:hypothetical protein
MFSFLEKMKTIIPDTASFIEAVRMLSFNALTKDVSSVGHDF